MIMQAPSWNREIFNQSDIGYAIVSGVEFLCVMINGFRLSVDPTTDGAVSQRIDSEWQKAGHTLS